MVVQDHVRGHHLGHAGNGHRPGGARSGHYAQAADVSGRDPVGRPQNRGQPLLGRNGRPGPRRDRCGRRCRRAGRRCLQACHGATSQAEECGQHCKDSPAPSVTSPCLGPPTGSRWIHTRDGAAPFSPICPARVATVSQRETEAHPRRTRREAAAPCDTAVTIPQPVHDIGAAQSGQRHRPFATRRAARCAGCPAPARRHNGR
jgi:hypothetical protein